MGASKERREQRQKLGSRVSRRALTKYRKMRQRTRPKPSWELTHGKAA